MGWVRKWFWSPVKPDENWAQTVFRVFGNLFRSAVTLAFLLGAPLIGLALYANHNSSAEYRRLTAEKAKIFVNVGLLEEEQRGRLCSPDYPLVAYVRNDSDMALMSMQIDLTGRKPGSSTNHLTYSNNKLQWDSIVPPGYAYATCWSVAAENLNLTYDGTAQSYTIELEPLEDWMLEETKAWIPSSDDRNSD